MEEQTFTIAPVAFDVMLLPAEARTPGTAAFRDAVSAFLQQAFQGFGGRVAIFVDDERIAVTWSPDPSRPKPLDVIVAKLQQGKQAEGIQLLELLLSREPDSVDVLYNLGLALSDAGKLDQAENHLRRAVDLAPRFTNGLIALGVALSRQQKNEEATMLLQSAVALEPENPWAQRNLGVILLKASRFAEAVEHLRKALALQPADQGSWVALGDALRLAGQAKEAERAYGRAMTLNPHSDFAEAARRGSSQLAQTSFQNKVAGMPRPDAVEYCIAAIKTFAKLPKEEVQRIAFEIAMVGRSGFDVNRPEKKYRLKALAGEFTGLQLVCYMYVGFQMIVPGANIGFDLSREYEAAKVMCEGEA